MLDTGFLLACLRPVYTHHCQLMLLLVENIDINIAVEGRLACVVKTDGAPFT